MSASERLVAFMDYNKFGKRLQRIRKFRDLTTQELSELVEVSSGEYISRYENGRRTPSLDTFVNICNALKISPEFLLQDNLTFYDSIDTDEIEAKLTHILPKYRPLLEKTINELLELSKQDNE